MSTGSELLDLERNGWEALATSGEAAAAFYDRVLASTILMLFPGDFVIDDRAQAIETMRAASAWQTYALTDERVLELGPDCAVVAYRASARRGGDDYAALFNSTYVREDGAWKLALHQQTPV